MNIKKLLAIPIAIAIGLLLTLLFSIVGILAIGSLPYILLILMNIAGLLSKGTTVAAMLWVGAAGALLGNFAGWVTLIVNE